MGWYKTGTVSVENGEAEVVGTGTSWITNASTGMGFLGPDGQLYEIAVVSSASTLTLATPYAGPSAPDATYSLLPTQDYVRQLASQAAELVTQYSEAVNLWTRGEFDAGTVAAPGINFDGTANGLYMPEENTVCVVTDGVERLRVDSDGNVSISGGALIEQGLAVSGVTSLSGGVSVTGNASVTGNVTVGGNTALGPLTLNRSNNDSTSRGHVTVTRGSGAGTVFTINSENTGANDVAALSVLAGPLGSGVERMRISSAGNVSIGTSGNNPNNRYLFVRSGIGLSANGTAESGKWYHDGTLAYLDSGSVGQVFYTGNAERMRLDAAGNLGIGGAAPANGRTLAVQNSGTGSAVIYAQNSTTGYAANNGMTMQLSSSDGYLWNYGNGTMVFGTNNAEVARFTAAGNLAIGATSSAYPLYVYRATTDVAAMLAAGTAGNATLYLNANGVSQNWLRTERATGDLVVATADTARARFLYSGDYVLGGTAATNYSGAGYRTLAINHTTGGIVEFQAGGVQQARITGWGGTLGVHTENVERVRVNSSGLVTQNGTPVGIGGNPSNMLDVFKAGTGVIARARNTANSFEISLGTDTSSAYVDSGNADLTLRRNGSEAVYINSSLNVGMGISPVMPTTSRGLHIHNATTAQRSVLRLTNADVGSTTSDGGALVVDPAGVFYLWNYENASMVLGTNNSDRVTITGAGNMLVGKTSGLGYKVDVLGQVGVEDGTIRAGWGAGMFTAGTMGFGTTSNHRLTIGTNAIARMVVSGSGTVTIGRLEPASGGLFEVSGNVVCQPTAAAPTLGANGDMSFQRVSDTQLKVLMRGSDGTTRSVTLTLT
jgi:hypothetical protein